MKTINIKTSDKTHSKRSIAVPFQMPQSLDEAIKAWGAEVVLGNACKNVVIAFQQRVRGNLAKTGADTMKDPAIIEDAKKWVPGTRSSDGSKTQAKLGLKLSAMTEKERQVFIAQAMALATAPAPKGKAKKAK